VRGAGKGLWLVHSIAVSRSSSNTMAKREAAPRLTQGMIS
jgi:hypothetical protein